MRNTKHAILGGILIFQNFEWNFDVITREVTAEESRKSSSSGGTPDLERATGQECGDHKLQEEHGGHIPPAQSHGLERGAAGEKGLLP